MAEAKRIGEILYKLGKLWMLNRNQRFGQLLFNYTRIGTRVSDEKGNLQLGIVADPFHYTDKDIEEDLDNALKERRVV